MMFSIYPTDSMDVRKKIIDLAIRKGINAFFVSLHILESDDLNEFLNYLQKLFLEHNFKFHADISPRTLELLNLNIDELYKIKKYGIVGLRIDFGFNIEEIKKIANEDFIISLNASTITRNEMEELKNIDFIGWHNFYPRPETGLNSEYFKRQNSLLRENNVKLYSFIPGSVFLRSPLYEKLPTVESHRYRNPYVNYLDLKKNFKIDNIVLSEGLIDEFDLDNIINYENNQIITIPIEMNIEDLVPVICDRCFKIRIEETDASWRVENTRGFDKYIKKHINSDKRVKGSIQMDNLSYKRYAGEVHIMKMDLKQDDRVMKIGSIKEEYLDIVNYLGGAPIIIFKRIKEVK